MEQVTGLITNVTDVATQVLTFMSSNALMMIGVAAGVLAIGIRVIRRFLPRG